MKYIVYWCEHLRDGVEEGGKVFADLNAALALINRYANGFAGGNTTFRLFEVGREIPLIEAVVEEPQPPATERRFSVRKVPREGAGP